VKLLFDENLSPRLVARFAATFAERTHVDLVDLADAAEERADEVAGRRW
jgi:predicted nuclease of predicted toxin-antitoxin system